MEWVTKLQGQLVAIDTAPLVYYIEQNPEYIDRLRAFFSELAVGAFRTVTSTVTLLEVLIQPLRLGDEGLAHRYNDILLSSPHISTLAVTCEIAQSAAELRARHNLKTPDAIHLATAIIAGASVFLTNDRALPTLSEIEILRLDDVHE